MKRLMSVLSFLVLNVILISGSALAAPVKIHVAPFNTTGAVNNQELRQTLQDILTSRLNSDQTLLVEKPDQAERLITGSYAQFGRMFSLDILIKSTGTGTLVKVFEQGDGQEDVIPALGRLAKKIDAELAKKTGIEIPSPMPPASMPVTAAVRADAYENYVIRSEPSTGESSGSWSSAPLDGVFNSIATGRVLPTGERELFISGEQTIRAYLKGKELKQVAEVTIPPSGRILALDTADLDKDGELELYVTLIDRGVPSSRVYHFNGTAFVVIAENLPWLFRGIGNDAAYRIIYAQEFDKNGNYYGTVKELGKSGGGFVTKATKNVPGAANIFNFINLSGTMHTGYSVVLDEDGYLVMYPPDGAEAWKSSEKYGGSESILKNDPPKSHRPTGDLLRWTFMEQRITLLKDGTLLLPRNEGSFRFGNNRSFDKYSLFALQWTGAVLKEKWHTRASPGYLADYSFDPASGEVILLEVVKKPGMLTKGKSVVSINKIN